MEYIPEKFNLCRVVKGEKMLITNNATISTQRDVVPVAEPAKAILENMDAILKELMGELERIDGAIYSPRPFEEKNEPREECLLETLSRQRDTAQALLGIAIHIREGLW